MTPVQVKVDQFLLSSIEAERESRIRFLRRPDESVRCQFDEAVLGIDSLTARQRVYAAWDYAQSLTYHHPGQSKQVYLAHPMRLATMYMRLVRSFDESGVITAILHNVMEVSNVERSELAQVVSKEVVDAIVVLTVDRVRQWDSEYKGLYYKRLASSPEFVRKVKILDKLDNLFLLCLNPSDTIRERYLHEIELWLLPMTEQLLPELSSYLHCLVADNRRIGHISELSERPQNGESGYGS